MVTRAVQASQSELLELLASARCEVAACREQGQLLAAVQARVKELEASIASGHSAGHYSANAASEMEFLRKERRAEVEQVDQEWRRRCEALQGQAALLQAQVDAAADSALRANEQRAKEVECVRSGACVTVPRCHMHGCYITHCSPFRDSCERQRLYDVALAMQQLQAEQQQQHDEQQRRDKVHAEDVAALKRQLVQQQDDAAAATAAAQAATAAATSQNITLQAQVALLQQRASAAECEAVSRGFTGIIARLPLTRCCSVRYQLQ